MIAKAGIRTMLAKRAFLGLLLLAWFPFIVRAIQIYASANFAQRPQPLSRSKHEAGEVPVHCEVAGCEAIASPTCAAISRAQT